MIDPFPSNSIVQTGKYYRPSFLDESNFLKGMIVQQMTDNK